MCAGGLLDRCPLSLMCWLAPSRVRVSARRVGSLLAPLTGPCRPPYDLPCPGVLPARRVRVSPSGLVPAGWGSLPAPLYWVLYRAGISFPFAVRDMYRCAACTRCDWVLPVPRSFSLYHRVVYLSPFTGSVPNLSPFTRSVPRCISALWVCLYPGYLPSWEKKSLKLTCVHCNVLKIGRILIHKSLETCS